MSDEKQAVAEPQLPGWIGHCVVCSRIIDKREQSDGGDPHGCELSDDKWVCSSECYDIATEGITILVKPYWKGDGSADYYVSIERHGREVTPHCFTDRYVAEYHAATYRWLLHGDPEPDLMAFDKESHPNLIAPGWTKWTGGDQPVGDGVKVFVRYRNQKTDTGIAIGFDWSPSDLDDDIIAYKILEQ